MQWATAVIGIPVGVVLGRYALQEPVPFLISVSYRHSPSLLSVSISRSAFDQSVGFVRLVSLHRRFTFLASAARIVQMQQFSQNRAVHRNLKPVSLCLLSIFSQLCDP